jgi:hypothetical protein
LKSEYIFNSLPSLLPCSIAVSRQIAPRLADCPSLIVGHAGCVAMDLMVMPTVSRRGVEIAD